MPLLNVVEVIYMPLQNNCALTLLTPLGKVTVADTVITPPVAGNVAGVNVGEVVSAHEGRMAANRHTSNIQDLVNKRVMAFSF